MWKRCKVSIERYPFLSSRSHFSTVPLKYPALSLTPSSSLPPSEMIRREALVLAAIGQISDPILKSNLMHNGSIKTVNWVNRNDKDTLEITLDLFLPGHPGTTKILNDIRKSIASLPFAHDQTIPVEFIMSAEREKDTKSTNNSTKMNVSDSKTISTPALSQVKHIIAVSSCKGGVGKSSVAVQLAQALLHCRLRDKHTADGTAISSNNELRPLRIGLLDADVYGPSIPHLCTPKDITVRRTKPPTHNQTVESISMPVMTVGMVDPLETEDGLKVMSFGYVNPKAGVVGAGYANGAAVMRGPIVTKVITQLLLGTNWGALDYLILDMPPGTGDIVITICQTAPISGALIVTTPHPLATIDVVKGIEMFQEMKVPTLGIVENMSYFECDQGKQYHLFGKSTGKQGLLDAMNDVAQHGRSMDKAPHKAKAYSQLIEKIKSDCPYLTIPIIAATEVHRQEKLSNVFQPVAESVLTELLKLQVNAQMIPQVIYSASKHKIILRYFTSNSAIEYQIDPLALRQRYPHTGAVMLAADQSIVDTGVKPVQVDYKGNYGVNITWNDGYSTDIYPFDILRQIAIETKHV